MQSREMPAEVMRKVKIMAATTKRWKCSNGQKSGQPRSYGPGSAEARWAYMDMEVWGRLEGAGGSGGGA